jgi:ABC-type uncharacterized transport system ATPase component
MSVSLGLLVGKIIDAMHYGNRIIELHSMGIVLHMSSGYYHNDRRARAYAPGKGP